MQEIGFQYLAKGTRVFCGTWKIKLDPEGNDAVVVRSGHHDDPNKSKSNFDDNASINVKDNVSGKEEEKEEESSYLPPLSICFLEKAIQVWEEMHTLKFYGYGRGIQYADPYSEGIDLMLRVASFYCVEGTNEKNYMFALQLFGRAVELSQEIWGSDGSKAPDSVYLNLNLVHKSAYLCYNTHHHKFKRLQNDRKLISQLQNFLATDIHTLQGLFPLSAFSISTETARNFNFDHMEMKDEPTEPPQKRVFKRRKKMIDVIAQKTKVEVCKVEVEANVL